MIVSDIKYFDIATMFLLIISLRKKVDAFCCDFVDLPQRHIAVHDGREY